MSDSLLERHRKTNSHDYEPSPKCEDVNVREVLQKLTTIIFDHLATPDEVANASAVWLDYHIRSAEYAHQLELEQEVRNAQSALTGTVHLDN